MTTPPIASLGRAALLAATLGLAATAAQATLDLGIVVGTCPPRTASALHYDLHLTNGAVRKAGRNPPKVSAYFCDVPVDDLTTVPGWNTLELQFSDRNPTGDGNVRARLMRKSLVSGGAKELVAVYSVPSSSVRTVSVPLPEPLDFTRFAYFVIVELTTPLEAVEAHMVRLTTR
jgi:hypothetical protein